MKIGDLVKFFSDESDYDGQFGIIMRIRPVSAGPVQVYVQWPNAANFIRYPERQLEVVSESR
tara:strand:- start:18113 stop:18298 length:186 start_codon:yes stop_codon:yes gene_type:complete